MTDLVIEDGTGKSDANSYVDLPYAQNFAESIGLVFPADDETGITSLLMAMTYIESRPYAGQRATPTQALCWPRKLVTVDGYLVDSATIPEAIKRAQVTAAVMVSTGIELLPTVVGGGTVTKEKVGPIETEYSDKYQSTWNGLSIYTSIDIYLNPFLTAYSGYRLSPQFGF